MFKKYSRFAAIAAIALLGACTQIDTGNVGVESTLGQVKGKVLEPGVYETFSKKVLEVSAKEFRIDITNLTPQTKDRITMQDFDADIFVAINPAKAAEIRLRWPADITTVEKDDGVYLGMNYIARQAREQVYVAAMLFESSDIQNKRGELVSAIVKKLQEDLDTSAGKDWFYVRSTNIRALVVDPALEKNVKLAQQRRYEEQAKSAEIEVAKKEAERVRTVAQGEADAQRIRAAAIASQGGKEYLELKRLENERAAVDKWNGQQCAPGAVCGGSSDFVNVRSLSAGK